MARLNPHAVALKTIRRVELEQRLKAKKASIEKSKKLHKSMKAASKAAKAKGIKGTKKSLAKKDGSAKKVSAK